MSASASWHSEGWSEPVSIVARGVGRNWFDVLRTNMDLDHPGVYRLVVLEENGGAPRPLARICGEDPSGTLYVGASRKLANRLTSLVQTYSADYKSGSHTPMIKKLADMYPSKLLHITCKAIAIADDPFDFEYRLVTDYVKEFGEPPPLNGYGRYPPDEQSNEAEADVVAEVLDQSSNSQL